MLSCAKSSEDNINDGVANTKENLEGTLEDNNDTALDLEDSLTGGGCSNDSGGGSGTGCDNTKAFIVGNLVPEKGCHPNCEKNKAVIWNLCKSQKLLGDSSGVVDATEHNGSI
jgi:hypothetical protein